MSITPKRIDADSKRSTYVRSNNSMTAKLRIYQNI